MKIRLAHVTNSSSSDYVLDSMNQDEEWDYDSDDNFNKIEHDDEVRTILCSDGKYREEKAFKKYKEEKDQEIRAEFFQIFGKE